MKSEPEQLAMFKRIADGDFRPNENGLFDISQVAHLVTKRGCKVIDAGDYGCTIGCSNNKTKGQLRTTKIMVTDKGLWHPINIFRACREAAGQPHYEIDYAKAKIKNPGNLNEVLIAQIVGADGVRPYLSRPGQYACDREGQPTYGSPSNGSRQLTAQFPDRYAYKKPEAGDWTWPMACVVGWTRFVGSGESYGVRRALRALSDAGMIKLFLGPRGGIGSGSFRWLPPAYLAVEAPKLDHADAEYLTDLMAVS
jgi:hypothetical protein